jgi:superfamily II DNA or RNA helicase
MTFQELSIKNEYRTFIDNVADDFYIPLLSRAMLYRRAVGYFSSSVLVQISQGIVQLAANEGIIQIVASPNLTDEDIEAIKRGYERRDEIVRGAVIRELRSPQNHFEKQQLNLLTSLIAEGVLDVKIAFIENDNSAGMYHEKMGLISDAEGNTVAFSGSMNETRTAVSLNYETIDVFCSWKGADGTARVRNKECAFTSIWNDTEPNVRIIPFPELKNEIIRRYRLTEDSDYGNIDFGYGSDNVCESMRQGVVAPLGVKFRDYQIEAINNWEKAGFRGIFDMATGTGKTLTGLGAVARLCEKLEGRLAVFIVAPFQHLVEQWVDDIRSFGIDPIIGHSASKQKNWLKRLDSAIRDQKFDLPGCAFFCFVCTNATFSSGKIQRLITKIRGEVLLVADEAHNLGATRIQSCLTEAFNYRLALSATITRHNDEDGTRRLFDFFGNKCIDYPIGRAIKEKMLTPYKYYPVIVTFDGAERDEYEYLTFEIGKCLTTKNGETVLNDKGKRLAIKRARVVAGTKSKIIALENVLRSYVHDTHILVYCGACKLLLGEDETNLVDEDDRRQISVVSSLLGNDLGMTCSHFTSRESAAERAALKQSFAVGDIQALVAIKCLDEGVNIPAIRKAFILASTTNPKEYIQRRGRVLRLSPGKDYAEIYDFITLPYALGETSGLTTGQLGNLMTLVKNELKRAEDFASLALESGSALVAIGQIKDAYHVYEDLRGYKEFSDE